VVVPVEKFISITNKVNRVYSVNYASPASGLVYAIIIDTFLPIRSILSWQWIFFNHQIAINILYYSRCSRNLLDREITIINITLLLSLNHIPMALGSVICRHFYLYLLIYSQQQNKICCLLNWVYIAKPIIRNVNGSLGSIKTSSLVGVINS